MTPTLALLLPAMLGQPPAPPACSPGGCPPALMARIGGPLCPPVAPPAPVLAVKALLPDGATITAQPGVTAAAAFPAQSVFGFRPGYSYPLRIDLPGGGRPLYPVLEVRGSIVPRAGMRYMEFAAPLLVTADDVARVRAGAFVTKAIYLEDPTKAIPTAATADVPLETASDSPTAALDDAAANGRVVAVLRIGDRQPDADDLARLTVGGTILLPGEDSLGPPTAPPCLPCWPVPLFDPLLGPKIPFEECFINGGDSGDRVGIGRFGRIGNLDPTDVAAEYTIQGRRKTAVSNRVCICSPRFVLRRAVVAPNVFFVRVSAGELVQAVRPSIFTIRQFSQVLVAREQSITLIGKERPSAAVAVTVPGAVAAASRPQGFATVQGVKAVATVVEPEEITNRPELMLTKSVDPPGPVPQGTVVTITIRYANFTGKPVEDLVVSDSLSGRLEYVPGSAAADRPSNVTTSANDAGSVVVRFDLPGTLPPGTTGVVQFKAKVR